MDITETLKESYRLANDGQTIAMTDRLTDLAEKAIIPFADSKISGLRNSAADLSELSEEIMVHGYKVGLLGELINAYAALTEDDPQAMMQSILMAENYAKEAHKELPIIGQVKSNIGDGLSWTGNDKPKDVLDELDTCIETLALEENSKEVQLGEKLENFKLPEQAREYIQQ